MSGPGHDEASGNGLPSTPPDGASVLSNLPRARPQRSTARRAAARQTRAQKARQPNGEQLAAADALANALELPVDERTSAPAQTKKPARAAKPKRARGAKPAGAKPATSGKGRARGRTHVHEEVPRQGFECEDERATGSLQPPGGAELIASAAELIGELAKASINTGERLLKDMLSLLPRS